LRSIAGKEIELIENDESLTNEEKMKRYKNYTERPVKLNVNKINKWWELILCLLRVRRMCFIIYQDGFFEGEKFYYTGDSKWTKDISKAKLFKKYPHLFWMDTWHRVQKYYVCRSYLNFEV
jgi:hypothetical protein